MEALGSRPDNWKNNPVDAFERLAKRVAPATAKIHAELLEDSIKEFAVIREQLHSGNGHADFHDMLLVMVANKVLSYAIELERVRAGKLADTLPGSAWAALTPDAKIDLGFWLAEKPNYRAAVCLRDELQVSTPLLQCVFCWPSDEAKDAFFCRARKRILKNCEIIRGLSSPPFPRMIFDALNGRSAGAISNAAVERQMASGLRQLRSQFRSGGR